MPVYQNISKANLFLPREDKLRPDIELTPGQIFNGSEYFYQQYVDENLIKRTTNGWPYNGVINTAPNTLSIIVDRFIQENGITALASDVVINNNLNESIDYSCFGKICWFEGATEYQAYFSIIGNGIHGAGATFSIDASSTPIGAISAPVAVNSEINTQSGTITFALNGTTMTDAIIEIIYNAPVSILFSKTFDGSVNVNGTLTAETINATTITADTFVGDGSGISGIINTLNAEHANTADHAFSADSATYALAATTAETATSISINGSQIIGFGTNSANSGESMTISVPGALPGDFALASITESNQSGPSVVAYIKTAFVTNNEVIITFASSISYDITVFTQVVRLA